MVVLQPFQLFQGRLDFSIVDPTQPGEQRFFLIGGVLGRGLSEITQGRLERTTGFLRGRTVYHLGDGIERAKKHFDPPVAVGKQAGGVSKVMGLGSNLNRHKLRLQIRCGRAVTKVPEMPVTSQRVSAAHGTYFFGCGGSAQSEVKKPPDYAPANSFDVSLPVR